MTMHFITLAQGAGKSRQPLKAGTGWDTSFNR